MMKKGKKCQSGGTVPNQDWVSIYGSWFQNQNGQVNNQMQPNMQGQLDQVDVYAQGNPPRPPMGLQQPQPIPINNQVQAQPIQGQAPAPMNYSYPEQTQEPQSQGASAGQIGNGIAGAAYAVGDVFDALGGLKKSLIKGGAGILNALIQDNPNKRKRATQIAANDNRYGTGYDVLYENGGKVKTKSGAVVKEYGIGEHVPNLTQAQEAALNQFIPYPSEPQPIQSTYQPEYYTALPNGEFQINIPRHLQDRLSRSGRVGADYDQSLSRAYGYEGSYGNRDYIPTMQSGGAIRVESADDPRYKAYQDSTAAHNKSMQIIKRMREANPTHPEWVKIGNKNSFAKPLTPNQAMRLMIEGARNYTDGSEVNINPYLPSGKYKDWESKYMSLDVPGEMNHDKNGKLYPSYDYYDAPTQVYTIGQTAAVDPTPRQSIPPYLPNVTSSPQMMQGKPYTWDYELQRGVFPTYGEDNKLQGTWDMGRNGQTLFYPSSSDFTGIPKGLPPNTEVQPISRKMTNIREMENGGEIAQSGKTIFVDSKNDPRYRAYKDSLSANNFSVKDIKGHQKNHGKVGNTLVIGTPDMFQSEIDIESSPEWFYKGRNSNLRIGHKSKDGNPLAALEAVYYPEPTQEVVLRPAPNQLETRSLSSPSPIQGRPYTWDYEMEGGVFPTYGSDNRLQGSWDIDKDGQTVFYPISSDFTGIPKGLPSNTKVRSPYRKMINIREMQNGGMINDTGYLQGYPTSQNPVNIIPNNHITTQGMGEPILANGVPLFPNEGDYMFNQSPVVEEKYQVGQELDLDAKTIKKLKAMGYEFE